MKKEEKALLQEAAEEIQNLRSHNSYMNARLSMFDDLMLIFKTQPAFAGQGMGEDLLWKIHKQIAVAEDEETRANFPAGR